MTKVIRDLIRTDPRFASFKTFSIELATILVLIETYPEDRTWEGLGRFVKANPLPPNLTPMLMLWNDTAVSYLAPAGHDLWLENTDGGYSCAVLTHRDKNPPDQARLNFSILACTFFRLYVNRPTTLVYKEPSTQLKKLSYKEHWQSYPRTVTISLSERESIVRTFRSASTASSGIKRCEHFVSSHTRRLQSGRIIQVRPHRRGDPSIQPRTIMRVVP